MSSSEKHGGGSFGGAFFIVLVIADQGGYVTFGMKVLSHVQFLLQVCNSSLQLLDPLQKVLHLQFVLIVGFPCCFFEFEFAERQLLDLPGVLDHTMLQSPAVLLQGLGIGQESVLGLA